MKRKTLWYAFDCFHGKKHTFSTKKSAISYKMKQRKDKNYAVIIGKGWKKLKKVV